MQLPTFSKTKTIALLLLASCASAEWVNVYRADNNPTFQNVGSNTWGMSQRVYTNSGAGSGRECRGDSVSGNVMCK